MKQQKTVRILAAVVSAALLTAMFAGCGTNEPSKPSQTPSELSSGVTSQVEKKAVSVTDKPVGFQLEAPKKGEEIAVITTDLGVIKMRFFEDEAPKAVKNFKELAKQGYYDGVLFHRTIPNFMVQTGKGGGESIYGEQFEDEFTANLLNLRGSVSMANAGPNTNGTEFFINQSPADTFSGWAYYEALYEMYQQDLQAFLARYQNASLVVDLARVTDEVRKLYTENGGSPYLDGSYNMVDRGHTVFGQVFEGLDVVDALAQVETDINDRPIRDVKIQSIKLETYQG